MQGFSACYSLMQCGYGERVKDVVDEPGFVCPVGRILAAAGGEVQAGPVATGDIADAPVGYVTGNGAALMAGNRDVSVVVPGQVDCAFAFHHADVVRVAAQQEIELVHGIAQRAVIVDDTVHHDGRPGAG